ncbi:MAG TPA: hypothetical protein VN108_10410 [Marmoricola sp.]|nr:hypothetical protein [Marmoricola sp.]
MKRPSSWFLPNEEPVLHVLVAQWGIVADTLRKVSSWTNGTTTLAEIRRAMHQADCDEQDLRRNLHRRVRAAFWTPLDAEDIYELGERIGMLHRQLHLLVREADASQTEPDRGLAGILTAVLSAAESLDRAITLLPSGDAENAADEAAERLEAADHAYRVALASLAEEDIRREISLRELYQRGEHVTEATAHVAHRAWYAVCKIT